MTTEDNESAVIPEVLKQNIETLEELNQRFVSVLQNKKQINPSLNGPGQDLMVKHRMRIGQIYGEPREFDGKANFVLG